MDSKLQSLHTIFWLVFEWHILLWLNKSLSLVAEKSQESHLKCLKKCKSKSILLEKHSWQSSQVSSACLSNPSKVFEVNSHCTHLWIVFLSLTLAWWTWTWLLSNESDPNSLSQFEHWNNLFKWQSVLWFSKCGRVVKEKLQTLHTIGANVVRAHERFPCGGRRSGH